MPKVEGSGRKVDLDWQNVMKIDGSSKVKCKHCHTEISGKIERIKAHLKKCSKLPHTDKEPTSANADSDHSDVQLDECLTLYSTSSLSVGSDTSADTSLTSVAFVGQSQQDSHFLASTPSLSVADSSQVKKRRLQTSMNDFSIKTTQAQKDVLDVKVAKFFYGNNISFNTSNSATFKDMVESLRPGYKPPTAEKLGGSLLDKVSDDVDNKLKEELQRSGYAVTLLQDGWSSVKNDAIIAASIHTGRKAYLLETLDCGYEKKTAEFCAEKAVQSIKLCDQKYRKKVNIISIHAYFIL